MKTQCKKQVFVQRQQVKYLVPIRGRLREGSSSLLYRGKQKIEQTNLHDQTCSRFEHRLLYSSRVDQCNNLRPEAFPTKGTSRRELSVMFKAMFALPKLLVVIWLEYQFPKLIRKQQVIAARLHSSNLSIGVTNQWPSLELPFPYSDADV